MQGVRRWAARPVLLVAIVLAVLVAVTAVGAALASTGRLDALPGLGEPVPTPSPSPTADAPQPSPAGPVLASGPAPDPGTPLPEQRLARLVAAPALGAAPGAVVVDAASGDVLFDSAGAAARTPASVAKLATSAAALVAVGGEQRLTTRVVPGATAGEVVLVGGGDPTLTAARPGRGAYPRPASLAGLARATAKALRAKGVSQVVVRVDDTLFEGPPVSPDWRPTYVASGVVAPVSALAVDEGRVRPGYSARVADPAISAGQAFARLLTRAGVLAGSAVTRATAPTPAEPLAAVSSPTVADLVEQTLATSDNDLAEALFRHVALATGAAGTFAAGRAAVEAALTDLGVPTDGLAQLDGSGLARASRVSPDTVARLLAVAAAPEGKALRPLLSGLPVAGFSGTLDDRFDSLTSRAGAGQVRAKTGTLTGVSSLAGYASTPDGRLLAFAVMADRIAPTDTLAARDQLDRFAAALAA